MLASLNQWFKDEKKWLMSIGILVEKVEYRQLNDEMHLKAYLSTSQRRGIITLDKDLVLHLEITERDSKLQNAPVISNEKDLSKKYYVDWTIVLNKFILCLQNVSNSL